MLIAICDDEKAFRKHLKEILLKYKSRNRLDITISEFENGEALLNSERIFDIIFLDYQMTGIDGLEAAKKLRTKNIVCSIVFITNFPQFMINSFEVQPFRFFIKPIDEEKISELLNLYIKQQKLLYPITVINNNEQKMIKAQDILYLEGNGKYCTIRTTTDTYYSSKTLSQTHKLLPQHCFYRSHKSYVVNLYSIDSHNNHTALLTNGELIKIGHSKASEFSLVLREFNKNYYFKV